MIATVKTGRPGGLPAAAKVLPLAATPAADAVLFPAATLFTNIQSAIALGISADALYAAAPDLPRGPEGEVPLERYLAFWEAAGRLFGRPGVVSAVAMRAPFGAHGVLDYLAGSAETVGGALETARLHLSLAAMGESIEIADPDDGWVWLNARSRGPGAWVGAEYTLATLVQRVGLLTDGGVVPRAVTFAVAAQSDESVRTRLYGVAPAFGQPTFSVAFAAAALEVPLTKSDPMLHATLRRIVSTMALADARIDDLEFALRSRLRDALASGDAAPQRLARLLGLSERTLQRRLTALGRSFSQVLDDFRREEAARLLRVGRLPLVRVAGQLGYAEQASFTRAFRRWYGATPAAWRRATSAAATEAEVQ